MGPQKVPGSGVDCSRDSIVTMRAEGAFVVVLREDADGAPMMMPPIVDGARNFTPKGL